LFTTTEGLKIPFTAYVYSTPFSAYMSFQGLLQSIEDILTRFGMDYTIAFEIK